MPIRESHDIVRTLTRGYAILILAILGLAPALAIAYLHFFQDPGLRFEHHVFHEMAIAVSLLQGAFVTYVTWRCYRYSGEPFLRWLTLGFLGFTVIYALHGLFTRLADDHIWLFILYGPAARFTMAVCFLIGLAAYGREADSVEQRSRIGGWLVWAGVFALINVLVAALAGTALASVARAVLEVSAMGLSLICVALIATRRIRSPLMTIYALSLLFFAQSSLAFLLGAAWNHQWWLAHAIFASGFMALSYGVIQAFLTTGSFTTVYSQAELMEQIRAEQARTENALRELQRAHKDLENQAATDPLTGAANRREFFSRAVGEIARAVRRGTPLSVLVADLDHFKQVNDRHGHPAGDKVLQGFVAISRKFLRPDDLIGRIGGEEFAILLPEASRERAGEVAQRLRRQIEIELTVMDDATLPVTASLGVGQLGPDGATIEAILEAADKRMYQAKRDGRNRVVVQ